MQQYAITFDHGPSYFKPLSKLDDHFYSHGPLEPSPGAFLNLQNQLWILGVRDGSRNHMICVPFPLEERFPCRSLVPAQDHGIRLADGSYQDVTLKHPVRIISPFLLLQDGQPVGVELGVGNQKPLGTIFIYRRQTPILPNQGNYRREVWDPLAQKQLTTQPLHLLLPEHSME